MQTSDSTGSYATPDHEYQRILTVRFRHWLKFFSRISHICAKLTGRALIAEQHVHISTPAGITLCPLDLVACVSGYEYQWFLHALQLLRPSCRQQLCAVDGLVGNSCSSSCRSSDNINLQFVKVMQ